MAQDMTIRVNLYLSNNARSLIPSPLVLQMPLPPPITCNDLHSTHCYHHHYTYIITPTQSTDSGGLMFGEIK